MNHFEAEADMKDKATDSKSNNHHLLFNKAKFNRVLKRIEQGCTTVSDARFIRKLMAGINQEADGGIHS